MYIFRLSVISSQVLVPRQHRVEALTLAALACFLAPFFETGSAFALAIFSFSSTILECTKRAARRMIFCIIPQNKQEATKRDKQQAHSALKYCVTHTNTDTHTFSTLYK